MLAESLAMLANRSDAEFSEFLADYAEDLEADGVRDAARLKTGLEYVPRVIGSSEKLAEIRANMESWGLGDVPDFEKIILGLLKNVENVDKEPAEENADGEAAEEEFGGGVLYRSF